MLSATTAQRTHDIIIAVNERNLTLVRAVVTVEGVGSELSFRSTTLEAPDGLSRQRHESRTERARNALVRVYSNFPDYFREGINDALIERDRAGKHNWALELFRATDIAQIIMNQCLAHTSDD